MKIQKEVIVIDSDDEEVVETSNIYSTAHTNKISTCNHTKTDCTLIIGRETLRELNKERVERLKRQGKKIQAPQTIGQQIDAIRKKHKKKWREVTPTARSMTISDLSKKDQLIIDSKAGTWSSKQDSRVNTIENTFYDVNKIGLKALELTNAFRSEQKLPHLKWSQALCDIGRIHSDDMAEKKVPFGHAGFEKRVKSYPMPFRSAAENVAMNSGCTDVAKVAVDGWINSPGHRKNLLANHNYCGIGVYKNSEDQFYLTQLFALS
ncbi:hypothetical protein AKO1_014453 [Acrasis kona]|uniref:SCP domain-containing protein n=1 Tax=Acrasis kona TaxID=1008807 RepID=A0AAW2YZJ7_9EUKA